MLLSHHKTHPLCFHSTIFYFGLQHTYTNLSFGYNNRCLEYKSNAQIDSAYVIWCLEAGYYDLA